MTQGSAGASTVRPKALVLGRSYHTDAIEAELAKGMEVQWCDPKDEAAALRALAEAHALVPSGHHLTDEVLAAAPNLLAIGVPSMGYDGVDVSVMTRAGVAFITNTGIDVATVAELTVGLMLSLSRRVSRADRMLRRTRDWAAVRHEFHDPENLMGYDLEDKTVGIVGFGGIGKRLAQICINGFRMHVAAYDPFVSAEQVAERGGAKVDDLRKLASMSDFLCLHLPLTDETKGIINAEVLAAMKPSACLLNIARGGVVDEPALIEALRSGQIAGAAIDGWADEPPPPDHPFFEMENVVLTPHIGGVTTDSGRIRGGAIGRKLVQAVVHGEPPEGFINREVWPRVLDRRAKIGLG